MTEFIQKERAGKTDIALEPALVERIYCRLPI